ncbi:MAG: DUF92 domain-containing protein, partial [Oscillospiraceae bacterium]|nr:DUF92 domain-containing protein [Oscillospiraceae bacterium]
MGEKMNKIFLCTLVGLVVAILSRLFKLIKKSATILMFAMITALMYFGGTKALVSVLAVYGMLIISNVVFRKRVRAITETVNKKSGARDCVQLVANCLPAVIAISFSAIFNSDLFNVVFFSSIGEAVSDSMASDIGILSLRPPVNIIGLKPIQRGLSGGISLLGTTISIVSALYAGMMYFLIYNPSFIKMMIIFFSSFLGVVLDSILGSLLQAKFYCEKCGKYTEKKVHCDANTKHIGGLRFLDNCT